MFGNLAPEQLITLRLEMIYAAQKVQTAFVALISHRLQERNPRNYTAEQMKATKVEIEHAAIALRTCIRKILPDLESLAKEEATV